MPFPHLPLFRANATLVTVVNSLWRGDWVQQNNDKNDIDYVQYKPQRNTFWDHIDPSRICVPRYQNWFRVRVTIIAFLTSIELVLQIIIWLFFLFAYSQTVQQPIEMTLDPRHSFDAWEYILYGMALAFTFEGTREG